MKPTYYPILRIVLTLIAGIFMIVSPSNVLAYIAFVVGLLLFIPGLVQLMRYAIIRLQRNRRNRRNSTLKFPVLSALCALSGVLIMIFWQEMVMIFSLVLASGMLIAGVYEVVMIVRSEHRNILGYYIVPAILTLLAIFILINPLDMLPNMMIILYGIGAILYAISEIVYWARIGK